jgi:AbrB family looped-hinge helix DNA binding protein
MVQEKSKLTSKGQLTLPKAIRKALGVKEGDTVVFALNNQGEVQLRPERGESRFAKYRGVGLGDIQTDDIQTDDIQTGGIQTKAEMDNYIRELRGRTEE